MRTLSPDTAPEIERRQMAILRALPVWRKFELMAAMNRALSTLALRGLRAADPRADEREVRHRFTGLQLGQEAARRLHAARESRGYKLEQGVAMSGDPIEIILTVVAALDRIGGRLLYRRFFRQRGPRCLPRHGRRKYGGRLA